MSEKTNNRKQSKPDSSVNPQGLSEDQVNHRPKSQLEDRAKKRNTKI